MPTGLEIYKLLPRTNCKKCGYPTCLAFAMALAAKKIELAACPDVSEETKTVLSRESRPPITTLTFGAAAHRVTCGGETVLFRHEKTFYHPTCLAITIPAHDSLAQVRERCEKIRRLQFDRVGENVSVDAVVLQSGGGQPERFSQSAAEAANSLDFALILHTPDIEEIKAALSVCKDKKPLLWGAPGYDEDAWVELAKSESLPLVVSGETLEAVSEKAALWESKGIKELVIQPGGGSRGMVEQLTTIRRMAILKNERGLGHPVLVSVEAETQAERLALASAAICKYASIVALADVAPEFILPLVTLRFNLYTDPQKPIMMEPGVYEVGAPGPDAPLIVTTNFSLTYFSIKPEVEASRVPTRILLTDSDGMSVLTAWAADKFSSSTITKALTQFQLAEKVSHKKIIIPGLVASLSGELEEESGWQVVVGPREASALPKFLRTIWKA
ncbi:MAG: acetyl-CoA decarbonylase/synthase complex subunit gamma [Anaerolineales bacterium]